MRVKRCELYGSILDEISNTKRCKENLMEKLLSFDKTLIYDKKLFDHA